MDVMTPAEKAFLRTPRWIIDSGVWRDWPCQDVKVLLVICAHMDRKNRCYPSMQRFSAALGWSRQHISAAVHRLWKAGAIRVTRRQRKSSIYEVAMSASSCMEFSQSYYRLMSTRSLHKGATPSLHRTRSLKENKITPRGFQPRPKTKPLQGVVGTVIQNIIHVNPTDSVKTIVTQSPQPERI